MEIEILNFIQQYLVNPIFNVIFIFCTNIVEHGEVWILTALVMLITKKYRRAGLLVLIVLLVTFLSSEFIIKNLVCRPRPFLANPDIELLIKPPSGYSFPSSHSAVSFASATVIFYFNRKFGIAAYILAALTAFSRLYLYVHYPTDVLGGIIIGVFWALIVLFVYKHCKVFVKTKPE